MTEFVENVDVTHERDSFKIIRAIHLGHWSEKLDEVPFLFVQTWTEFDHFKTLRLSLWCVDNKYITSGGDDSRPESRRFKLTSKGLARVRRQ